MDDSLDDLYGKCHTSLLKVKRDARRAEKQRKTCGAIGQGYFDGKYFNAQYECYESQVSFTNVNTRSFRNKGDDIKLFLGPA